MSSPPTLAGGQRARWWLAVALVAVAAARWALVRVAGESMAPTLQAGDVVLRLPDRRVRTGTLVVVDDPRGVTDPAHRRQVVKRVAAGAGELADLPAGPAPVPAGHIAVEGDNRAGSTDSRHYGPVPLALVRGRVALVVSPGRRGVGRPAPRRG